MWRRRPGCRLRSPARRRPPYDRVRPADAVAADHADRALSGDLFIPGRQPLPASADMFRLCASGDLAERALARALAHFGAAVALPSLGQRGLRPGAGHSPGAASIRPLALWTLAAIFRPHTCIGDIRIQDIAGAGGSGALAPLFGLELVGFELAGFERVGFELLPAWWAESERSEK